MNRNQLIEAVARDLRISRKAAEKAVNAILKAIKDSLRKGNKVTLDGFGTFSVAKRSARKGRSAPEGKGMGIKARKIPLFKAGRMLIDAIDGATTPQTFAIVRVFFATDRAPTLSKMPAEMFGVGRASKLSYGSCEVSIPHDHKKGELESPSILRLEFREDPEKARSNFAP